MTETAVALAPVQAGASADPKAAVLLGQQCTYVIVGQAARVGRIVVGMLETSIAQHMIQATVTDPDPQCAVVIPCERADLVPTQAIWRLVVVTPVQEAITHRVVAHQAVVTTTPEPPLRVHQQGAYSIRWGGVGIAGAMTPDLELHAVVARQRRAGGHPEVAFAILQQRADGRIRQAVGRAKPAKLRSRRLQRRSHWRSCTAGRSRGAA